MTTSLRPCWLAALLLSLAAPTRADNSPESGLASFKQYVLPKISYACGTDFSIEYDGKSLRQHDEYIAHDQKSGDQECNEPFRYLWSSTRCTARATRTTPPASRLRWSSTQTASW